MTGDPLQQGIELLTHSRSPKRRSGARRLRKLGDPAAGPALLAALEAEVRDVRTWETQYQLIMAVGECRTTAAAPLLRQLVDAGFGEPMVHIALGDALLRLGHAEGRTDEVFDELLGEAWSFHLDGATRALAMLRLPLRRDLLDHLLDRVQATSHGELQGVNPWFWAAAACPGWLDLSPRVRPFLEEAGRSALGQVRSAAEAALLGKYKKWSPG